jgi:F0F1-type ATP synthase assembly protein I
VWGRGRFRCGPVRDEAEKSLHDFAQRQEMRVATARLEERCTVGVTLAGGMVVGAVVGWLAAGAQHRRE